MAVYGNSTTLGNVSKILCDSHVEPQLGGKKALIKYMEKKGKHSEKGEKVLYSKDLDEIQDVKGQRNDLNDIKNLLELGVKPNDIMAANFRIVPKLLSSIFQIINLSIPKIFFHYFNVPL